MKYQKEKLKIKFKDSNIFEDNYSQAAQDLFVLMCLNGKRNGSFLDLGCGDPIEISNTYLLESKFDWDGISIDINKDLIKRYHNIRKCKTYIQDATKINFDLIIDYFNSTHIDYLSLDLEPANITLDCLEKIPFDKIEFSLITFEHDYYRFGEYYRNTSRKLFEKYNYKLICSDVSNEHNIYEDWYYNPKYISSQYIEELNSDKKEWINIIYT